MHNPAFDYDGKKHNYAAIRKADPRIAGYVAHSLRDCETVLNVGAGAGSYEPPDKYVVSVEPSLSMRTKRLELGRHPAINATADKLPFDDQSFDATLAILTIHHWPDLAAGLKELARVTKRRIALLTYDPDLLEVFWNAEYFPEVIAVERRRYPALGLIRSILGRDPAVTNIKIPLDCSDGFQEAFYGRPEAFLDEEVRRAQSAWGFIDKVLEEKYVARLREELANGEWERKYGFHRTLKEFEGAYRVLEFEMGL